jgi:gas vesicle protein
MPWFKKKKEEGSRPEKKKRGIEKLVMGAIIGVAVGSVVGMAVAPQKGSETRKMIGEKGREAVEKGREIGHKFMEERKVKKGFLDWLLRLIFGRNKRKPEPLKKIPSEQPVEKGRDRV